LENIEPRNVINNGYPLIVLKRAGLTKKGKVGELKVGELKVRE